MPKPKGGLGRGLGSLIPQQPTSQEQAPGQTSTKPARAEPQAEPTRAESGLAMLPIDNIAPNPHQPRQVIKEDELDDLAASVREHGILQPLVVTRAGKEGGYNLIAGERRWRAAMLVGLDTVP